MDLSRERGTHGHTERNPAMTETQDNPYEGPSTAKRARPQRWVLQVRLSPGVGYTDHTDLSYEKVGMMRPQIELFNAAHSYPQYRIVTR